MQRQLSKRELAEFVEAYHAAHSMTRELPSGLGLAGFGVAHLLDGDGKTKQLVPFANLITTAGDQYYAQKGIVGISPAAPSAPTAVSGMKLGTNSATAAAKSGSGAALVTYLTGSNQAFISGFPTASAVAGTDTGWNMNYKSSWAAGTATASNINEVVICNDAGTNATSTAANTISRAILTTVNKTSTDILDVTWSHKALGA